MALVVTIESRRAHVRSRNAPQAAAKYTFVANEMYDAPDISMAVPLPGGEVLAGGGNVRFLYGASATMTAE
jgi:hypothetical protein